jgi:hypothetical protein
VAEVRVILSFWRRIPKILEWIEHSKLLWDFSIWIFTALGGGALVRAALMRFLHVPSIWATPIWFFTAAILAWLFSKLMPRLTKGDEPQPKRESEQNGKRIDGKIFAAFIERGQQLWDRLASIQRQVELPNVQGDIRDWVHQILIFLAEAGLHTEAVIYSHVAKHEPSAEQMAAVAHFPEWKQYDLAQLRIYCHRLEHIKEDKQI